VLSFFDKEQAEMTESTVSYDSDGIGNRIFTMRGQKVILDSDLAAVYGVEVRALNQQVNRNRRRFPEDFAFYLTDQEWYEAKRLGSQNVILKRGQHRKSLPLVFTEHGALMAANVLNSNKATEMSVFVVRAFIRMRAALTSTHELMRQLAALEREIKARLDSHDVAIVDVLRRIMDLIAPPTLPEPPPKKIGFCVKERRATYGTGSMKRGVKQG
jgi:phage regulator Rha-like protein